MSSVYKSLSKQKPTSQPATENGDPKPRNRQRLLILSSRGVTFRYVHYTPHVHHSTDIYRHRHLLTDLHALLPHSRKDAKLDTKQHLPQLNELADLYNCNNIAFFEARKSQDLYLWLAKPPNGPTIKMHCQNIHTMEELNFTGNCLKGSRPVLSFDAQFEGAAHLRVLKELLTQAFGVPERTRGGKPFVDHVMAFTMVGGKIWVRVYQISETEAGKVKAGDEEVELPAVNGKGGETNLSLVEIGPRFVLTPIVMLEGSFGGPVIYENKEFVSPNQVRSDVRRVKAGRYNKRAEGTVESKVRKRDLGLRTGEGTREVDELDERVLFR